MTDTAKEYHQAVHAAASGSIDGEEEAQLTSPVSNLFRALVRQAGFGELHLIRETRTGSTRPDFAALHQRGRRRMQKGYVELKAPSVPVDVTHWSGRNLKQWERMKDEADILIVCNGREAQLYRAGIANGPAAPLPYDRPDGWDPAPLTALLQRFIELRPAPITAIGDLTKRLAVRTRDLRDRIEWLLDHEDGPSTREAKGSFAAWRRDIYPAASKRDFADGVSQVIAYGMVLAALTPGGADTDGDGYISVDEARASLRQFSPVLAAAFAPLIDKPVLAEAVQVEIGGLETLVSAIKPEKIASPDRRGDAWLRFYEDFLSIYDPDERREAGVYYTPLDAVAAMTAMTGHLLTERLGKRMGFVGLRQWARELADEIWVLDLGGDNKGANPEDNIFAIETPVAIVTLVRDGASDRKRPARVNYRRLRGTSEGKLAALARIGAAEDPFAGEWQEGPSGWLAPLMPPTGDAAWEEMPLLTDLFPWQQPGCKFGRTWPIAPSVHALDSRWRTFAASAQSDRPSLFATQSTGKTVATSVRGKKLLSDVTLRDPVPDQNRYGYRSFDRQHALSDPRLANGGRPVLWQNHSTRQVYLASLLTARIGHGPSLTVSPDVPDLHFFRGSFGGKDIIPLYRDAAAHEPNLADGLPAALARLLGIEPPSPEDIAAYVYALLSPGAYQQRFAAALERPGLRVPITADAELWAEAVAAGRELLWLHTYAERFVDPAAGRPGAVPAVEGIGWDEDVRRMPETPSDISYDAESGTIRVGDGRVGGVRPEVWAFSVSGMQVLPKWLGYRTRRGAGRAVNSTSALDRIRPTEWADEWNDELLDLVRILTLTVDRQADLADLLDRVCEGELIAADDLPAPGEAQRKPPPTR